MANPTVQNIIDRAVERSALNNASLINIPAAVAKVSTEQRKVYLIASQLDPEYFGTEGVTATRAAFTDSWSLDTTPGNVGAVTAARVAAKTGSVANPQTGATFAVGDEINLVNFRFLDFGIAPRAYVRGRKIVPVGTELGTTNSIMVTQLRVYYSELPAVLAAVGTTVSLPDEWQELLILPLARSLALRDKREEEVAILDAEYMATLEVFKQAVLTYGHGVQKPSKLIPPLIPFQESK